MAWEITIYGKANADFVSEVGKGKMTPKEIRDALLSLSDEDRKFVITDPEPGEKRVFSLARDGNTGKVTISCKDEVEP